MFTINNTFKITYVYTKQTILNSTINTNQVVNIFHTLTRWDKMSMEMK